MPSLPAVGFGVTRYLGDDSAGAGSTVIATHATNTNTKGSWVEIDASTPAPVKGIIASINVGGSSDLDVLFDIGIGAATSESVVVSNIQFSQINGQLWGGSFFLPLSIPEGVRVAVRCQGTTAASSARMSLAYALGTVLGSTFYKSETWGANTADSGGTSVDPGGSINTYGGWSQLVAASVNPIRYVLVCAGNQLNTARAVASMRLQLGIGAATSEVAIAGPLVYICDNTPVALGPQPLYFAFPINIPPGVRVAARSMSSITDATDRLMDVTVVGVG